MVDEKLILSITFDETFKFLIVSFVLGRVLMGSRMDSGHPLAYFASIAADESTITYPSDVPTATQEFSMHRWHRLCRRGCNASQHALLPATYPATAVLARVDTYHSTIHSP